ncbi:MAG TPA: Wzz/FepE/Etk N-terminal domain-containing protein [Anaerovoracaceae bacterium]|nr:Wzz/FepE/Etk N-terminal domain-containing protein [Anaerovoracaceae bacterium]
MESTLELEFTLSEIISIIIKRIWIIVLCIILGTAGTFTVTKCLIHEKYTASVSMYVAPNSGNADLFASLNELNYAQKVVNTYIEILKTDNFMSSVAKASSLGYSVGELKKMVEMSPLNDTEIFKVKVTTTDPKKSLLLANTIARLAPEKIIEIKDADAVRVVDPATLPEYPSSPNVLLNIAIGFALGFIIGIMAAFIIEMMDKRVKDEDDLLKHYDVPVLGVIPIIEEV